MSLFMPRSSDQLPQYSHIPNLGRPNLGRFWEKMQKSVIQKFSKFRPVFRWEFIFGKKMQQLFEKARDFELFFRGFGGFCAGIWIGACSWTSICAPAFSLSIWRERKCSISDSFSSLSGHVYIKSATSYSSTSSSNSSGFTRPVFIQDRLKTTGFTFMFVKPEEFDEDIKRRGVRCGRFYCEKRRGAHKSSAFFLFKLTMRKLERKLTFKNKFLFKFPRKKPAKLFQKERIFECHPTRPENFPNLGRFWNFLSPKKRPKFGTWLYGFWCRRCFSLWWFDCFWCVKSGRM